MYLLSSTSLLTLLLLPSVSLLTFFFSRVPNVGQALAASTLHGLGPLISRKLPVASRLLATRPRQTQLAA